MCPATPGPRPRTSFQATTLSVSLPPRAGSWPRATPRSDDAATVSRSVALQFVCNCLLPPLLRLSGTTAEKKFNFAEFAVLCRLPDGSELEVPTSAVDSVRHFKERLVTVCSYDINTLVLRLNGKYIVDDEASVSVSGFSKGCTVDVCVSSGQVMTARESPRSIARLWQPMFAPSVLESAVFVHVFSRPRVFLTHIFLCTPKHPRALVMLSSRPLWSLGRLPPPWMRWKRMHPRLTNP